MNRVFVIGATKINEDASTASLTNEQARKVLQATFPEVATAIIRERTEGEGDQQTKFVEFQPIAGRKG
jgi:hypothetical protein